MPWTALALGGSALLGALGSNTAGNQQASGDTQAANTLNSFYGKINDIQQPYIQAGTSTLGQLTQGLAQGGQFNKGFTPQDFLNNLDPGYGFQLQQGEQAIRNQDTPTQGALSGSALKDLIGYNQGMASTGYQNAFNRYQTNTNNIFSRLSSIAGLGEGAAGSLSNAASNLGSGIAGAQAAGGAAKAGGTVGATNSLANGLVPLASLLSGGTGGGTG